MIVMIVTMRRLLADAVDATIRHAFGEDAMVVRASDDATCRSILEGAGDRPAVVIDLEHLGCRSSTLVELVSRHGPSPRIGIYDSFTPGLASLAFDLGIKHLLASSAPLDEITSVLGGQGPGASVTRASSLDGAVLARIASLTPAQYRVLALLADGRGVRQIAQALGVSTHTVDTHKRRLFTKLDVHRDVDAIAVAISAGIEVERLSGAETESEDRV
jgi:DNA-binding NarL/FixJ family response regulator